MAKKVTATLLVILLVLCIALGIYFATQEGFFNKDKDKKSPDKNVNSVIPESTDATVEVTEAPTQAVTEYIPDDEELDDNTDDITTTEFRISRVVDHTTGDVVQPRVVFGSGFNTNENYITFDTAGKFEMYFSGFSDTTRSGNYTDYGDIIYVEYTDGKAAEYDLVRDENDRIIYIVVNYGDYDVYFA